MPFKLPDLPYDLDALEPHISARTMEYHYTKHHQGYVDKLNEAVKDTPFANKGLESIIRENAGPKGNKEIFNNAAQVWNHTFFWNSMSPDGGGTPDGAIGDRLSSDFGSFDAFKEAFSETATGQFGSGWAWLVINSGRLDVLSTPNAEPPFIADRTPLLTCDVWEHAYYLDYQNERGAFVDAFLNRCVNWQFANDQLAQALESTDA